MKKTILILFIILIVGAIAYFYYIKPQREIIKISTQNCIDKAMKPINSEIAKYSSGTYKNSEGIKEMLKTQDYEINKCLNNYNTILFSPSEVDLVRLNLTPSLNYQASGINSYLARVNSMMAEQKATQDKKKACSDMQANYDKYNECTKNEVQVNNNKFYSTGEYITSLFSFAPSSLDSKDVCLQKYNYKKYGVDLSDCMMIGIFGK